MILRITLAAIVLGIGYLSLSPTETIVVGNDKISHFIAYAVLMINVGLITYPIKKHFVIGIIISLLYGGVIEVIQHYVPGRYMSVYDMFANATGVLIGALFIISTYNWLIKILKKSRII